jgi:hypothetical protein
MEDWGQVYPIHPYTAFRCYLIKYIPSDDEICIPKTCYVEVNKTEIECKSWVPYTPKHFNQIMKKYHYLIKVVKDNQLKQKLNRIKQDFI